MLLGITLKRVLTPFNRWGVPAFVPVIETSSPLEQLFWHRSEVELARLVLRARWLS